MERMCNVSRSPRGITLAVSHRKHKGIMPGDRWNLTMPLQQPEGEIMGAVVHHHLVTAELGQAGWDPQTW